MAAKAEFDAHVKELLGSYRAQKGWLTRACLAVTNVVNEATTAVPSRVIEEQLRMVQRKLEEQVLACEEALEKIREYDTSDAASARVEESLNEDNEKALGVSTGLLRELARYETAFRPIAAPPPMPAQGLAAAVAQGIAAAQPAPAAAPPPRVLCKPNKDLKPSELTADMSPVEFSYWFDAFSAYHSSSHMEVATIAEQQAYLKNCVACALFGRIQPRITQGVTPVIGDGDTLMGYLKDLWISEHPLFARRLKFFRYKQQRGQLMSDSVAQLQRLGDQATLGALTTDDLYVMRYLTLTPDEPLMDKMLEVEVPTKQLLKDVIRRFEGAARNKVTIVGPAAAAAAQVTNEAPAQADAVQRGQRQRSQTAGTRPKERSEKPPRPYTSKQMDDIFAWYTQRSRCAKCGNKWPAEGAKHECPARGNKCKSCLKVGHSDVHCFVNWKPPPEDRVARARQTYHEEEMSDAESDVSYASARTRQT